MMDTRLRDTLFGQIAERASLHPEAIALQALGKQPLTYGALHEQVRRTVDSLNGLGLGRGDRIAIVMPNGPDLATLSLAVVAGATAVPMNPDYKLDEYEVLLRRVAPKALIVVGGLDHPARAAAGTLGMQVVEVHHTTDARAGIFALSGTAVAGATPLKGLSEPGDEALILQTSGTTGRSKIVPLTQANLAASSTNLVSSLSLSDKDRVLHFLPMFHIGGILDVLGAPLAAGGCVFCAPSFSADDFYRDLASFRPTWTQGVPVMLEEMIRGAGKHAEVVANHRLRFVRSVSAPLPAARMKVFEETFSVPVIEIYGMTETAGVITSNPLPPAQRKAGSVGVPAGPSVRLIDADGSAVPKGAAGEITVKGANVTAGYEAAPEDNQRSFLDGWFRTGDLGRFDDDGYLYLTGRVKDMINRGGEKVTPQEVDEMLQQFSGVADAATFAVPHPTLGEDVAALVVARPGESIAIPELQAYLRARLAFFKVPKAIHVVEAIPRGANGKLQRAQLTRMYADVVRVQVMRPPFVQPGSVVARALAAMWADILGTDDIGINDDFFDIGGDSLKAASFINALQQKWGETIYVSSVFDAPTIAKYEHYLSQHYPDIVARMTGATLKPVAKRIETVTPAMVEKLESLIARPLGNLVPVKARNKRAIFVLSPPRSGSTLLRAMMAGHSRLFAPPELYLLSYDNLADRKHWFSGSHRSQLEGCVRAVMQARNESATRAQDLIAEAEQQAMPTQEFYGRLQEWIGDRMLVDKTPAYAVDISTLRRAETYFEEPIYVHLLRHPYGMIRSFEEAKLDQLWFPRLTGTDSYSLDAFPFERRQLAEMIWMVLHRNILAFLKEIPQERQYRLRFEDVVASPDSSMKHLCEALGIDFDPEMLKPQSDKRQRMTDGIHDVSRMIGDPKFHQHKAIEASVADQWKQAYDLDFLSNDALQLANEFGYFETVSSVHGREDFEI